MAIYNWSCMTAMWCTHRARETFDQLLLAHFRANRHASLDQSLNVLQFCAHRVVHLLQHCEHVISCQIKQSPHVCTYQLRRC